MIQPGYLVQWVEHKTWAYPSKRHLFYQSLASLSGKSKSALFDEFEEHLFRLNLSVITDLWTFLKQNGEEPDRNAHQIDSHLRILKVDCGAFCRHLQSTLE